MHVHLRIVGGAAVVAVLATSCAGNVRTDPSADTASYAAATVTVLFDDANKRTSRTFEITNTDQLAELASFFPGIASDKSSRLKGGWITHVRIEFRNEKREIKAPVIVLTDYDVYTVDNRGDLPVREGLRVFIRKLLARPSAG